VPDEPRPYRLPNEPSHVVDDDDAPLPGHYEATFVTDDGRELVRFLTDKGRTTVLRILDAGTDRFTDDDLETLTVEPDLSVLVERMAAESGEGA
jgi:hypothetical protein